MPSHRRLGLQVFLSKPCTHLPPPVPATYPIRQIHHTILRIITRTMFGEGTDHECFRYAFFSQPPVASS